MFPGRSSSIGTRRSTPSARIVASVAPRSSSVRAASPADTRARASSVLPTRINVTITAAVSK